MSTEFKQEEGYIVFKLGDLHRYCPDFNISSIERVWQIIAEGRALEGKRPFSAVVIENDLPENEPIWKAIEARVTGAQPAPIIPEGWKLVPIEPTPGMIDAAEYVDWGDADVRGSCINAWDRMLAAAPEAKP